MFVDTLYSVVKSTGARSSSDLTDEWWEKARAALHAVRDIDEETRRFVLHTIHYLIVVAVKNLRAEAIGNETHFKPLHGK
ncbi:MAG TPA: hypothetical protein DCM73_04835 [Clostridiales bacterium]|nr:hypothetical protein [Clostridiales bacterium]